MLSETSRCSAFTRLVDFHSLFIFHLWAPLPLAPSPFTGIIFSVAVICFRVHTDEIEKWLLTFASVCSHFSITKDRLSLRPLPSLFIAKRPLFTLSLHLLPIAVIVFLFKLKFALIVLLYNDDFDKSYNNAFIKKSAPTMRSWAEASKWWAKANQVAYTDKQTWISVPICFFMAILRCTYHWMAWLKQHHGSKMSFAPIKKEQTKTTGHLSRIQPVWHTHASLLDNSLARLNLVNTFCLDTKESKKDDVRFGMPLSAKLCNLLISIQLAGK